MDDDLVKHLDLIQSIISRLAGNSFLLKGWSVTLVSAVIGFGVTRSQIPLIAVAYVPTSVLWVLDGYYLWQERLFRTLYNDVRIGKVPARFELSPGAAITRSRSLASALAAPVVVAIHGSLLVAVTAIMIALVH